MTTPEEWAWFKERTHVLRCEDMQGIVAFGPKGIEGIVVFDTWTPVAVNVHFAIENPFCIRAGLFREVAIHAFAVCGRDRMFGLVPSNNEKALSVDRKIGFTEVARIKDTMGEGIDTIVMRLDREDCRYLPDEMREAA